MKNICLSVLLIVAVPSVSFAVTPDNINTERGELRFTENAGQIADWQGNLRPDILFTAHSSGVKLFVTHTGIHYQFNRRFEKTNTHLEKGMIKDMTDIHKADSTQFYRLDMQLVGANADATILKQGEGSDYENFYLAHCPNGVLGVKNYTKIIYQNIYPNIDWIIYSRGKYMEYDFVVKPGGDVNDIKMKYDGAIRLSLDEQGNLFVLTPLGSIKETNPFTYQGTQQEIGSRFKLQNGLLTFSVDTYNKNENLVIDPVREWATYYGGSGWEESWSVSTDNSGNVYIAGKTESTSGIASGGFQNILGGMSDALLVKFDNRGNRLWATYYGGSGEDAGYSVTTNIFGGLYLAGVTNSTSGIASGGFQNSFKGYNDAFLIRFDGNGNRLWATYYGGTNDDEARSVATDIWGNVYISGRTWSTSGIASNGFQNSFGGGKIDGFLVKFDSSGNRLWATYYGGSGSDGAWSVITDTSGNVYLGGWTSSPSGIASGGYQNTLGGKEDAFLVKLDGNGNRLWATYYGGAEYDDGFATAIDVFGNIYLTGRTGSTSGIASNGHQNTIGGDDDAFLIKFSNTGNLLWATYYGGSSDDAGTAISTDTSGNVYLTGWTGSSSGIASGGFQNTLSGYEDGFLVKFNSVGKRLWATYYGGSDYENGCFISTDVSGNIYLTGMTMSTSDIASGGFQNSFGGGMYDAFLVKFIAPITINQSAYTCNGLSYIFPWGDTATIQGVYSHTYQSAEGNDSTVNITLTVNSTYTVNLSDTICNGGTYTLPWGDDVTDANIYSHSYQSISGCDSTVHITLSIVNRTYTTDITDTLRDGIAYTLPWGITVTEAGKYSHTYNALNGCDSVINIILTAEDKYTFNDIPDIRKTVLVYPNPNKGIVYINSELTESFTVEIFNNLGQLLLSEQKRGNCSIDIRKSTRGIYFIKTITPDEVAVYKIIKD